MIAKAILLDYTINLVSIAVSDSFIQTNKWCSQQSKYILNDDYMQYAIYLNILTQFFLPCKIAIVMIEIDQSNKIERTNKDTILAASNVRQRVVVIPAKVKRQAIAHLKMKKGRSKFAYLQLFAVGIFILLRPFLKDIIKKGELIMIDTEYTGHEDKIKGTFLRCTYQAGFRLPKRLVCFQQIGKNSDAHYAALRVNRQQSVADHYVSFEELLELI